MKVPPSARRLFPEVPAALLDLASSEPFVINRVLEAGDSADLAALFSQLPENEVRCVFRHRGDRQLDQRNRAFWSLLLAVEVPENPPVARALWVL